MRKENTPNMASRSSPNLNRKVPLPKEQNYSKKSNAEEMVDEIIREEEKKFI